MRVTKYLIIMAAIAVVFFGGVSRADVVYSNLGPGDSYNPDVYSGWMIGYNQLIAGKFTVSGSDYHLGTIEVALSCDFPEYTTLSFSLAADADGFPGTYLETVSVPQSALTATVSLISLSFTSGMLLEAGATYWVVAEDTNPATYSINWAVNNTGVSGAAYYLVGLQPWAFSASTAPAFRVSGAPAAVEPPTDLGLLSGYTSSTVAAINASGLAVGFSYYEEPFVGPGGTNWYWTATRACAWEAGATSPTALPLLDGYTDSWALCVNDSGLVAGECDNGVFSAPQACVWEKVDGAWVVTGLGFLPGTSHNYSKVKDMNASGQVVGESGLDGSEDWAGFIWDSTNGMQPFTNLPDGTYGASLSIHVEGISDTGLVAGQMMSSGGGNNGGIVWNSISQSSVATFDGAPMAVSPLGRVAGTGDTGLFVWYSGGTLYHGFPTIEPPLPGAVLFGQDLYPYMINDNGQILAYGYAYWDLDGDGYVDYEWDFDGDGELEDAVPLRNWLWFDSIFADLQSALPTTETRNLDWALMNGLGHVALSVASDDRTSGAVYLWDGVGGSELLGCLGGDFSSANCITDADLIGGSSAVTTGTCRPVHACIWGAAAPPVNQPPIADAGSDQTLAIVHDGDPATNTASVTLDGTLSSDPDGDDLTYSWAENDVEIAIGAIATLPLAAGVHTIVLTVTDTSGASDTDEVVVTLAEANAAPTANAGVNRTVIASGTTATVALDGSGSTDPDADPLTYSWVEGATTIGTGASPSVSLAVGIHTITLTVSDAYGATDTDDVVITVNEPAPLADLVVSNAIIAQKGKSIAVTVKVTNPNTVPALNVNVTVGSLGGVNTVSRLPLNLRTIKPNASKSVTLKFSANSVPSGLADFVVGGTCTLGDFSRTQTVTVP